MPLPEAKNYPASKHGPNSVLTDIGNRLTNEQANNISNQHQSLNYIGHGSAGVAYQHRDANTVVKLTRDWNEAERASALIGKEIPCCVQVLEVTEAGSGVWKLIVERVTPLSDEEIEIFDLIHVYGRNYVLKNKSVKEYFEPALVQKCVQEYQKLIDCLTRNGVDTEDAQGSNLGRKRGGMLCLLDVG